MSTICLYVIRKVAGIPNINGSTGLGVSGVGGVVQSVFNAFTKGPNDSWGVSNNGIHTNDSSWSLYFSASKSNSIYGSSSTVTPLSLSCKFVIRY